MKALMEFYSAITKAKDSERQLLNIRKRLNEYVNSLQDVKLPKYSGWFVLLTDDPDSKSGYKFVGFFNPDQCEEDGSDEPEWTLCIPILDKNSIPEFLGW